MPKAASQQFILLPPRGLKAGEAVPSTTATESFLRSLETVRLATNQPRALSTKKIGPKLKVLDSIHEQGAKLVEISPDDLSALRAEQPGLRVVPVVYYTPAEAPRAQVAVQAKAATSAAGGMSLKVVAQGTGAPIAGAMVVAFTNFAQRAGLQGKTSKSGVVKLKFPGASVKLERLYIYAEGGFWNGLRQKLTIKNGDRIELLPIDLSFTDSVHFFHGTSDLSAGQGVKVGIIDTGVGPHRDLVVEGGENTVQGEDPGEFTNNGEGHGTHVAGIVAARGTSPTGVRGIAPGVTLRAYRVFGRDAKGASNFAIAKAIDRAVADGCDLINMSLGGPGPEDPATHSAITDARAKGTLVIVAAGNDSRSPVSSPAADSLALAVSALGRVGTFPPDTTEVGDVAPPPGTDQKNFIASFSNVGPEIDLTGPGVGVISTFPNDAFAVLDGTSMASPAVTGAAAKLLAANPAALALPRTQERSDKFASLVLNAAKTLGFPATFEGQGLIKI
jgi:subtilisin family serine protease